MDEGNKRAVQYLIRSALMDLKNNRPRLVVAGLEVAIQRLREEA